MLCEKLQNTPNIKEQIEQTFDFIEGDVISYETTYASGNGKWSEDGKAKKVIFRGCEQIMTPAGNEYLLLITCYDENDFEPELIGITEISLWGKKQGDTEYQNFIEVK